MSARPHFVAQVDQWAEDYKQIARLYASLYKGLLEEGVPEDAAVEITCIHIATNTCAQARE